MTKRDGFINQYSISKTLRFSLLPVGKTEEHFNHKLLLEKDKTRAQEYQKVKEYIDRYHKYYIESVLKKAVLSNVSEYAELYYKSAKTENDFKTMEKLETAMRKQIAGWLTKTDTYKLLDKREMIEEILPEFLKDADERATVEMFRGFATYFSGFYENRKNMYSAEPQSTAIAYRVVHENLPKFLDNAAAFAKVKNALPAETMDELNATYQGLYGVSVEDVFSVEYFSFVLAQSGIDRYNDILGGYTCEDQTKVKGLNEHINLYNQQVAGNDRSKRLPLMKALYKQILSERETVSFLPEQFASDNAALLAVKRFYEDVMDSSAQDAQTLFAELETFDPDGIFVRSGPAVNELSNAVFGSWSAVVGAWEEEYRLAHPLKGKADPEKYEEKMKKAYKAIASFSLAKVQALGAQSATDEHSDKTVVEYYKQAVAQALEDVKTAYEQAKGLLDSDYEATHVKKLCANDEAIDCVKTLLDAIKNVEHLLKSLRGSGKEESKDSVFYGRFTPLYETLSSIDRLYDKVRNYVTKKPYSKDKIKLNFDNPQLLGGWDRNKERDYRTILLRKNGMYYLAIMDKSNNKAFMSLPSTAGVEHYEKMEYKLLPGPNKMLPKVFFAASNIDTFAPSPEILAIRKNETFKKGDKFKLEDCHQFIDFFKASIERHEDWKQFGFRFSPTEKYRDISEFYNEVKEQGYSLRFQDVDAAYINGLVESGQLYLFQIYNKDFSPHSKGRPNLHTMYFKMLFDERNLKDVVFQLNGGAEMFYREASIRKEEQIVHPANQPIDNKNPNNPKTQSTFVYDLIKDRRFTKRQFALHLPITLNFKADGKSYLNEEVRAAVKNAEDTYVIGIDRGERHLLYICVINGKGEIVEQRSLNQILGEHGHKVDYHALLDKKEAERDAARKSWGTIENIKELKEGYLSIVVHEICQLMLKYDAIVALEDLNFGFKRGRFKVEKQVYQKFENMLIQKLNFLVDKTAEPTENGGVLRAYQLTNKVEGVHRGKQNGFLFYVPAWMTSKIDPTTGFVDLLKPRYTSVADAKGFISVIDVIRYNQGEDLLEFDVDLDKFPRCTADFRKRWTVCSNADRIETFRNPQKNNMYDNRRVVLTEEWKALFAQYGVPLSEDMKEAILGVKETEFYRRFMKLMGLTLQMRNSITGDSSVDYLTSPVRNRDGLFFDSRNYSDTAALPANADANGAYHIARKALQMIDVLKQTPEHELAKADLTISNADWLAYTQK
ncbi:MAG: type V CRISPR-associated protein Cas12a/Cpf1 [Clostridia bacterium]|nr:type V CRISPR-associated protein Cas12a/Cpf1 [Clostridia bacterium]